jgi:hypothetical protein
MCKNQFLYFNVDLLTLEGPFLPAFFLGGGGGVEQSSLLLRPLNGLFYQPRMMINDDECGAAGGMFGRGNLSTRSSRMKSSGSAVGIASSCILDDREVWISSVSRVKNFHFSISLRPPLWPTGSPIQCVPGDHSLGVKRTGHEADLSPTTSAEVKKT